MTPTTATASTAAAKDPIPEHAPHQRPPKLPLGARFIATKALAHNDAGKLVVRRKVAINQERREAKALGLSGRQLRRQKKQANREYAALVAAEEAGLKAPPAAG